MALKISNIRLDYFFKVLKQIFEDRAQIYDPEIYREKIMILEKQERPINKQNTADSFSTMMTASEETGQSLEVVANNLCQIYAVKNKNGQDDLIIASVNQMFNEVSQELTVNTHKRLSFINIVYQRAKQSEQMLKQAGKIL